MASKFDLIAYKKTTDWWYPNYDNDMVMLGLVMCTPCGTYWKVFVSGNDDFSLEKSFENNYEKALELYLAFLRQENITLDFCRANGLIAE